MGRQRKSKIKKKGNIIKNLNQRILQVFYNNPNKNFNHKQIAAKLDIQDSDGRNQIIRALKEMEAGDRLDEVTRGKYVLVKQTHYHEGIVDITARGNAYVVCDDLEHDVYVPSRNLNHALNKDLVRVYVYKRRKNSKLEGDIVAILERSKYEYVGVLQKNNDYGFVVPDDPKMYSDIFIGPENLLEAKDGDKVLAKLTDWPQKSKNPFGEILKVLGRPGDHDTEIHSILVEYGLPYTFPDHVEEFA